MHKVPHFSIEEMTPDHSEWQELVDVITQGNQAGWAFNPHFEQFTRYFLTQVASVLFNDECNHGSNEKQNNLNLKPSGSNGMNSAW